jgi:phage N-6-adenine-methyltransferase
LFDKFDAEFRFTLDPCAEPGNAKCKKFFTEPQNSLLQSWANETVLMNPPYSKTKDWMKKPYDSARNDNATVVCLIKSVTDTQACHRYAKHGEVRFVEGRLKFGSSSQCAPFFGGNRYLPSSRD